MKVTFYKSVLKENGITPTDRIVFCQILYLSLMEYGGPTFNSNGEFTLKPIIEDYAGYVPLSWRVSEKYISEVLNISLMQSYLSFKSLRNKGYLTTDKCGDSFIRLVDLIPYFELKIDSGLHGLELIVYSYLADKNKKYGWIDKYHNAIARDLNLSIKDNYSKSFERILYKLSKKGFLERKRKGYQVLLKVK